jgi:hypothetical protein
MQYAELNRCCEMERAGDWRELHSNKPRNETM